MKKINYYFIIMAFAFLGFTSCADDEPALQAPTAPTVSITVSPEATEYLPGTELTYTIVASPTEGKLFSLEVKPSVSSNLDSGLDTHIYNTTETVTYTYIVPFNNPIVSIEFKVTAVNPDDYTLFSQTVDNKTFGAIKSFDEIKDVKLFFFADGKDAKNQLRLDNNTTYTRNETINDVSLRLPIDLYAFASFSVDADTQDLISNFYIGCDYTGTSAGRPWLTDWGGFPDGKPYAAYTGLMEYPLLDWDAFLPEDLLLGNGQSANVIEGDIVTFKTSETNVNGDVDRDNIPSIGAIKITETNLGPAGDGVGGYIVFDYKITAL